MTLLVAGALSLACVSSAAHTDGGQALASRGREGGTGDFDAAPLSGQADAGGSAGFDGGAGAGDGGGSADADARATADAGGDANAGDSPTDADTDTPGGLGADAADSSGPSACVLGASTLGACFLP
jgi:hypothetical protein